MVACQLTILFVEPYWVGVCERRDEQGYAVARFIFGSEPTPPEVLLFVLREYQNLSFSQPIAEEKSTEKPAQKSFKRLLRESRAFSEEAGITSKAQEAMRLELEKRKQSRKEISREERDAEAARKYALRQERLKEKKRGH